MKSARRALCSWTLALSAFGLGQARAEEVVFTLDPEKSQVLVCDQTGVLAFIPRVFLSGETRIDFQGSPPIPTAGSAPILAPVIDFEGSPDPAQASYAFVITSLSFQSPAPGVTTVSSGFVQGVDPGTDALVIDRFGFGLVGSLSLDLFPPLPPTDFPFAETFSETAPGSSPHDFQGTLSALSGGGDCDLSQGCTFSNEPAAGLPDLDAPCDVGSFCAPEDLCFDVVFQNTHLGDLFASVKVILVAESPATPPPPSCAPTAPSRRPPLAGGPSGA
ncbi:MAG: hypothetical protein K8I02_02600, partial [Candidatus Methylomirabilis sp.]|nr:hypothetical protein [Deltaproteobacteria bacterium]